MNTKYTESFKIQAVEKALSCADGMSQNEVATELGVGKSTLSSWIAKARSNEFESNGHSEQSSNSRQTKEKRPQDWSQEERFSLLMACHSLDENATNQHCRKHGIYPHHLVQWEKAFMGMNSDNNATKRDSEIKKLKSENKILKVELNRKEKALAETAALLVLKKKVHEIWGTDEDNSL